MHHDVYLELKPQNKFQYYNIYIFGFWTKKIKILILNLPPATYEQVQGKEKKKKIRFWLEKAKYFLNLCLLPKHEYCDMTKRGYMCFWNQCEVSVMFRKRFIFNWMVFMLFILHLSKVAGLEMFSFHHQIIVQGKKWWFLWQLFIC